jgi:hypothetical protein
MKVESAPFYRLHSSKLRQGDVAFAEFVQLRSPHDLPGPGPETAIDDSLPFFGEHQDFKLDLATEEGKHDNRVLRLWKGPVVVLHQACELDWASDNDSRLIVAPLVLETNWPGDHWTILRKNLLPGFFYLPAGTPEEAARIGGNRPLPEAAVALSSTCLVGRQIVERKRYATLSSAALAPFQNAISRFFTIRGYQELGDLAGLVGKRIVGIEDTGQWVEGPSLVVKIVFGENLNEADDADDEASMAYFGVRRSAPRQPRPETPFAPP